MAWLDARDETFFEQYPYGVWLYDATGRLLENVIACDTETGEAIICRVNAWNLSRHFGRWLFRRYTSRGLHWFYGSEIPRRHGFWPRPLQVVPKRAWIQPG